MCVCCVYEQIREFFLSGRDVFGSGSEPWEIEYFADSVTTVLNLPYVFFSFIVSPDVAAVLTTLCISAAEIFSFRH